MMWIRFSPDSLPHNTNVDVWTRFGRLTDIQFIRGKWYKTILGEDGKEEHKEIFPRVLYWMLVIPPV